MKKISILLVMIMAAFAVNAQVAINKDGSAPDAGSILHVKNNVGSQFIFSDSYGNLRLQNESTSNGGGNAYIEFGNSSGSGGSFSSVGYIGKVHNNSNLHIQAMSAGITFRVGTSTYSRIDPSGNWGIGTTLPTVRLDVSGDAKTSGDITSGGDISATGDVTASGDLWGTNGYLTDNLEVGGNSTLSGQVSIGGATMGARQLAIEAGSNIGVYVGNNGSYASIYATNAGTGPALYVNLGNIELHNSSSLDIAGTGEVNRAAQGSADLIPIAYGIVNSDGTTSNAGTGNWSASWTNGRYEITITGENFYYSNYIVVANNIGSPSMSISYGSQNGKLVIYPKNSSGSVVQDNFSFVVYKP